MKKPISQGRRRWKAFVVAASALALTLTLLPAVEASAEPDRSATLNRANPKFTWESSASGVPDPSSIGILFGQPPPLRCTDAPFKCEYILLDVEAAGELTLTLDNIDAVDSSEVPVHDIDGRMYRSNAAGEPLGNTLTKNCVTPSSSETCKVAVGPGFYVVEVEYYLALDAHYIGTAELAAAPGPPTAEPQMITLDDCNFTLYYFKDSVERLQALVPPDYRVRPYPGSYVASTPPLETTEGSATIAAAAYDCDRIEVPGSSPAPGIVTVLSVLVYPPDGTEEGAGRSDFYVLWIHANNPQLVELLASRGMPAELVPGMLFEKPLQSLGARVEVPWSPGAYELATTGLAQDLFHSHDNTYLHVAAGGRTCHGDGAGPQRECLVRMDFVTHRARDHFCTQSSDDHHAVECGKLTAEEGTPVASFFGASDRTAETVWDHEPLDRSWFVLQ